jgi:hypothetical protein
MKEKRMNEWKTRKLRAYIGKREREKRDSEHKDSTNTWMGVVQERKRAREKRDSERKDSTNTWMGVVQERKRAREKRDHEYKGRKSTGTGAKKRCRKRSRHTVDGATLRPSWRADRNMSTKVSQK